MVVDDNGKGLFSTGLRHGDAIHVGVLDPDRKGLEVFEYMKLKIKQQVRVSLFTMRQLVNLFKGSINKDVGRG